MSLLRKKDEIQDYCSQSDWCRLGQRYTPQQYFETTMPPTLNLFGDVVSQTPITSNENLDVLLAAMAKDLASKKWCTGSRPLSFFI